MRVLRYIAFGSAALAATANLCFAQNLTGRIYAFHSGPQGGCPGLDWHVVADGDKLSGFIAWGNMQHVAKVNGTVHSQNHTFQMTAQEVGGEGRTATITGSDTQEGVLIADINGPVSCKKVTVHWFTPPPAS